MNNIRMFVFFMGVVLSLGAQNDPSKDFIAKALTVYPVSPEAASLGKYGDLPINLASGKINSHLK